MHHMEFPFCVSIAGDGDSGDHWTVVCEGSYWPRGADIMLRHVDTEMLVFHILF